MAGKTTAGPDDDKLTKAQMLGLAAMAVGVLIIANDFTALSVAIPAIEKDFGVSLTTAQWVINGYAMVFGVLIVTGGRLADMFGRRLGFFVGAAIFAFFSFIGGVAPDIWLLLASRFLMGVGGALMWPAILGMTYGLLPESKKGLAGGIILGAAGFGNAVGPLIGGVLTDAASWRWIFFLNLPIAAFGVLVTWLVVPKEDGTRADHKIDFGGIAVLSAGLIALLLALDEGTDLGWLDVRIIGLFVVAILALTGFVLVERRAGSHALVPRDVLENREFAAAALAVLLMSALFFAALLYLPQFMMKRLDYSAIEAGAGLLPMMGLFAATSFIAGPLYNRLGPKIVITAGAIALTIGMFLLSRIEQSSPYGDLVPGMAVLGVGVGLFYSSITTAGVTALDKSRASLAGAIIYMAQIAGGSIGLGLNTAIVVSNPVLADGIGTAFLVDACLAIAGLLVVVFFVGGKFDREKLEGITHYHRGHG
ncbi:MFS transporter [Bauldia litoralis]|uniref:Drug resistance transporter, EmrB/QacA subfamily n=1 Tax=Bauldia litoralis TaxID=665467 RepID=A0A1G6DT19_9HYPH|nr:MFS transporter [Bauldia litoralis]SDB48304.1 drug resistance transporter, EmrB/QacA subfamily [Bauldia litoralis]